MLNFQLNSSTEEALSSSSMELLFLRQSLGDLEAFALRNDLHRLADAVLIAKDELKAFEREGAA